MCGFVRVHRIHPLTEEPFIPLFSSLADYVLSCQHRLPRSNLSHSSSFEPHGRRYLPRTPAIRSWKTVGSERSALAQGPFGECDGQGQSTTKWLVVCSYFSSIVFSLSDPQASFPERVQFVDDHLPQIFDSAERPLDGDRWWLNSDDPWQVRSTAPSLSPSSLFST